MCTPTGSPARTKFIRAAADGPDLRGLTFASGGKRSDDWYGGPTKNGAIPDGTAVPMSQPSGTKRPPRKA